MNPFADDEPVRIEIGKTESGREMWVDLRRELSIGVEDAFQSKIIAARFDKEAAKAGRLDLKDIDLDINLGQAMSATAKLEMWIMDWQMYDRHGIEVELSTAAIAKLSRGTVRVLLDVINGLEAQSERLGETSSGLALVT